MGHLTRFLLFFSMSRKKSPADGVSKPFEETLIARLRSLLPVPDHSSSISLSWLSGATDLLTLTLADLAAIISDPSLSVTDYAALSSYLDSSVALLDACNAISSAANRIIKGRLLVRYAIQLLSSSPSLSIDQILRARSALSEWEAADASPAQQGESADLSRLRPKDRKWGKFTAVRRSFYAVEMISDLVVRSTLASLGKKEDYLSGIRVSNDFPWAASYNDIVAKISAKLCCGGIALEIQAAKTSVRELAIAVDNGEEADEVTEGVRDAVRRAAEATDKMTEGVDRLAKVVNALFRATLETRKAALQRFRVEEEVVARGPGYVPIIFNLI